jgi:hypothetical protein
MIGRIYVIRNNTPGTTLNVVTPGGESTSLGTLITVPYLGGVDLMHTGATTGTTWDVMQFRSSQTKGELIHSANLVGVPVQTTTHDTASLLTVTNINGCRDSFVTIRPTLVNVEASGYATHNAGATFGQGEFILTINGVAVTTAFYSSANPPSGLVRVPGIGVLTYTAILPAGTHIIQLQIKPWATSTSNPATYHNYNIDAVATGYAGATTTADRDALKPMLMVNAFSQ